MPVRVRVAATPKIRLPALNDPPSYSGFLKAFKQLPENHRALPILEKQSVDNEYRTLLERHIKHDDISIRQCMQEAQSPASQALWKLFRGQASKLFGARLPVLVTPEVQSLKLPLIGNDTRRTGGGGTTDSEVWDRQTYKDFAKKLRKMNPDEDFTKALMDDAFRMAVSQATRHMRGTAPERSNAPSMEKMMKRCLSKESDQFWQKGSED